MTDSAYLVRTVALAISITLINFSLHAESIADHLWKNRVIVTFSSTKSNPERLLLKKQIDEFNCEFKTRDLVHIDLIQGSNDYESLSKKFSISGDKFTLLLLGKDGEVKLVSTTPSLMEVFTQIDAMPMRRREIQGPSANKNLIECPISSPLKK
jgi:hypothetical protein